MTTSIVTEAPITINRTYIVLEQVRGIDTENIGRIIKKITPIRASLAI
jgi:hypothetical protein